MNYKDSTQIYTLKCKFGCFLFSPLRTQMRGHRAVSAIAYAKILLYPLRLAAAGGTTETDARPLRYLVILERGGRRNSRRASVYHSTAKHDLYSRPGNTVLYGWPRNILRRIYIRLLDGTSDCDPFWASVHDKQKWNQPEPFKWEKLGLLRPARERIAALRQGYPFSLYPLRLQAAGGIIVFSHTQSQG